MLSYSFHKGIHRSFPHYTRVPANHMWSHVPACDFARHIHVVFLHRMYASQCFNDLVTLMNINCSMMIIYILSWDFVSMHISLSVCVSHQGNSQPYKPGCGPYSGWRWKRSSFWRRSLINWTACWKGSKAWLTHSAVWEGRGNIEGGGCQRS